MMDAGFNGVSATVQDGLVPVLDLGPQTTYRRLTPTETRARQTVPASVEAAVRAAGWPGIVLPKAQVLGVLVYPVVRFTGAAARLSAGQGPQRRLEILESWEAWSGEESPPEAPLRVLGFVSCQKLWSTAVEGVRCLSGLGAGMVIRRRCPPTMALLDADATGVWVVQVRAHDPVSAVACDRAQVLVTGRFGALSTAQRVPATRLMEEALFAHALHFGALT